MYKVVLVEDEALLREGLLLTTPWQACGYAVAGCAGDAREGERMVLDTPPDLVITDIRLGAGSGLDMITALTGRAKCEYIIISGYDDFDYAQRAITLGVKAYLLKPIDDGELVSTLNKVALDIARRQESAAPQTARVIEQSLSDRHLGAANAFIRENFMHNITVKNVADALLISESYLTKLFRRKTGRSFLDTLTLYRMREAERLLIESDLKIYEIASRLGYQDTQYFSALFRRITGVNPSDYKRER